MQRRFYGRFKLQGNEDRIWPNIVEQQGNA
jgi:hypothetical protein